jgi:hypothetical protein
MLQLQLRETVNILKLYGQQFSHSTVSEANAGQKSRPSPHIAMDTCVNLINEFSNP